MDLADIQTPADAQRVPDTTPQYLDHISVVVPVYNEALHIGEALRRIHAVPIAKEVIVVDDGSTDGTREFLHTLEKDPSSLLPDNGIRSTLKIIFHPKNQGKGAAIRSGVKYATGEVTVIQDADLEYDPRDYLKMLPPILEGDADVVYGSRFRGETQRIHYFWHALGNKALTLLSNALTDLNLTDMETCYKMFRTHIIQAIPIRCNRFGFEPEITAKIAKLRCRIYEVPISYHGRGYEEGKKITWKDGIRAVFTIFRFWLTDDLYDESTAGLRTLRMMEGAGSYNHWLFEQCKPYLGARVLEVGSGVGNISKYLLQKPFALLTDYSEHYVAELRNKFGHLKNIKTSVLDLLDEDSVQKLNSQLKIDTILSLNVLEHIKDDRTAIANMYRLLGRSGRIVLLVPSHQWLFSPMDSMLEHHRRYDKMDLRSKLEEAGFKITSARYLNWLGALGWFVNGRILRRKLVPSRQLRLFDFLIVLLRIEKFIDPPFGLSLLIVAEKR